MTNTTDQANTQEVATQLPSTLRLEASIGDRQNTWNFDYTWDCAVPEGLTTIHAGLLQKGFGELLRDASSTCKAKNAAGQDIEVTPEHRNTAVLARLAKFKAGTYVFGGGGTRGPSQTIEQAAWLTYFRSKKSKLKLAGKKPTKDNLEKYQMLYVKEAVWPSIRNAVQGLDRAAQDKWREANLENILKANFEKVINLAKSDPKAIKPFIDAETLKREGKSPQADNFHVEIDIKI